MYTLKSLGTLVHLCLCPIGLGLVIFNFIFIKANKPTSPISPTSTPTSYYHQSVLCISLLGFWVLFLDSTCKRDRMVFVWLMLLSVNIKSPRSILVVENARFHFYFSWPNNIPLYVYVYIYIYIHTHTYMCVYIYIYIYIHHNFFIHSFILRQLDCFCILTIVNNAAVNTVSSV